MNRQYSRHAKNLASYFGASLIPMALNLAINPWIAKNMSPEDYAISGYYTSFTTLRGPVIVFYMVHYYIKEYFRRDENERTQLFATIAKALIWFSGTISIACFFLLLIYIKFIDSNFSLPISPYLALAIFAIPLTGLLNLQLARYRIKRYTACCYEHIVCRNHKMGRIRKTACATHWQLGSFLVIVMAIQGVSRNQI